MATTIPFYSTRGLYMCIAALAFGLSNTRIINAAWLPRQWTTPSRAMGGDGKRKGEGGDRGGRKKGKYVQVHADLLVIPYMVALQQTPLLLQLLSDNQIALRGMPYPLVAV